MNQKLRQPDQPCNRRERQTVEPSGAKRNEAANTLLDEKGSGYERASSRASSIETVLNENSKTFGNAVLSNHFFT